jgi:hypothetical protein
MERDPALNLKRRPYSLLRNDSIAAQKFSNTDRSYPHHRNTDRTFDSICPDCLITIATSELEDDLVFNEKMHRCDPSRLRQLWGIKKWFKDETD